MKNPLNPEHSPLNQDPTGRNSMGPKFNPTLERRYDMSIHVHVHKGHQKVYKMLFTNVFQLAFEILFA